MDPVPDLVTMHLWTVPDRRVPIALLRMAGDRGLLGRTAGLRFAKLLGTGDGRTFTVRDADRNRWGLLATWDHAVDATAFETGRVARGWGRIATNGSGSTCGRSRAGAGGPAGNRSGHLSRTGRTTARWPR